MFRWGMLIGTAILAILLCKFCVAKRRRCRNMRQQIRNQQLQMQSPQVYQPYGYPTYPQTQAAPQAVNQFAYPSN